MARLDLVRIGDGVVHRSLDAARGELRDHSRHLRVAHVRHVLLEGDPEDQDRPFGRPQAAFDLVRDDTDYLTGVPRRDRRSLSELLSHDEHAVFAESPSDDTDLAAT